MKEGLTMTYITTKNGTMTAVNPADFAMALATGNYYCHTTNVADTLYPYSKRKPTNYRLDVDGKERYLDKLIFTAMINAESRRRDNCNSVGVAFKPYVYLRQQGKAVVLLPAISANAQLAETVSLIDEHDDEYTATLTIYVDGRVERTVEFHARTHPETVKMSEEHFLHYWNEFSKPLIRSVNERRRHLSDKSIFDMDKPNFKPAVLENFTIMSDLRLTCEQVLTGCTPTQRRRFELYRKSDYTLEEIAVKEVCYLAALYKSIQAVEKKLKKFLREGENSLDF
jgi:predicted DNA-binding protein YlxM (UPF0122 family)